jgi:hypothetical protein
LVVNPQDAHFLPILGEEWRGNFMISITGIAILAPMA